MGANPAGAARATAIEPFVPVRPGTARPIVTASPAPRARRRRGRLAGLTRMPWPLIAVLGIQAALSLRLIWSNTAFEDEALYLWTGHLEITHLLYHGPIPQQQYLSGAPVLYPVLGAIADSYGGLAAARALSLAFMLAATTLLYLTAARLFGKRAGVAAAAVFAALGPVQALGAFATYDAMAIFGLALSAWLATHARGRLAELWLLAAAVALALADATKYASALWDPVVISLAALAAARGPWRSVLRGARLAAYTGSLILAALAWLAGPSYLHGALVTTLHRQLGDDHATVASVAQLTLDHAGILIALALAAFAVSFTDPVRTRLLCGVLAFAALLAPLHQAQIHVLTSLDKHLAFGAWFAAIAAGYLLDKMAAVSRERGWRVLVAGAVIVAWGGVPAATAFFHGWPSSARMIPVMRSLVRASGCPCLAAESDVVSYGLGPLVHPGELTGPYFLARWDSRAHRELVGIPAYQQAIRSHYFRVVEIDPAENPRLFAPVVAALAVTPGYRLAADLRIPGWGTSRIEVWQLEHRRH
jgi:hypothetical protein